MPDYPEIHIVVGSSRCGTTFLSRMLRESMDIALQGEPKFVVPIYRRLHRFGSLAKPANLRRLIETIHTRQFFIFMNERLNISIRPEEIIERVQEPTYTGVLYAVFQLVADKRKYSRLGYTDPIDSYHLPLLARLLPTARFIHIIRDGRDVALSLQKFLWGPTNLYSGARYWAQVVSTARRDGANLGNRYFEFRVEDLTSHTHKTVAELGEFINRGDQPEQVAHLVELVSNNNRSARVQVWKGSLTERQRYLCEAAAGNVLRSCGYPTEFDPQPTVFPLTRAFYLSADFALRTRNRLSRAIR